MASQGVLVRLVQTISHLFLVHPRYAMATEDRNAMASVAKSSADAR